MLDSFRRRTAYWSASRGSYETLAMRRSTVAAARTSHRRLRRLVHERRGARNYRARLSIGRCRASKTGETLDPPKADYYLSVDERGPVLYEIEASGAGAAFRNAWADEFGQHFFGWVTSSHAWEFRFPRDASQKPERLVFVKGTYTVVTQGGSYRPVGEPSATCPLNEVLSSPAPTSTPPS
jgi:hypothetical protein